MSLSIRLNVININLIEPMKLIIYFIDWASRADACTVIIVRVAKFAYEKQETWKNWIDHEGGFGCAKQNHLSSGFPSGLT